MIVVLVILSVKRSCHNASLNVEKLTLGTGLSSFGQGSASSACRTIGVLRRGRNMELTYEPKEQVGLQTIGDFGLDF